MITHNLIQGSIEWAEHRRKYLNASDAPAMLGVSPYKTRTELLHEIATGITPEIDECTQRRFDDGHYFESLARPVAEGIIGDDLFPVVGSEGKLSASFDGLTMCGTVCFEHKTYNCSLKDITEASQLPEQYRAQMEQQLMVSGASKCLFMATKWDDEELVKKMNIWYESDQAMRDRIIQGWAQFEIDLKNYVPPEYIPAVVATPTKDLPAISIQVNGSISLISNLDLFGAQLNAFVEKIDKEPNDDQGFADAEAAIKTLQKAEDALEASESSALAQTADIDDMRKTVRLYKDTARTTRLMLKKMVEERKKSIKIEIMQEGKDAYAKHLEAIDKRLGKPYIPKIPADFAGAVSGAKSIKGLRERMKNELLRVQLASTEVADKVEVNLNTLRELTKDHAFLFADTAMLVLKENEDLVMLIKVRISEHEAAQVKKEEDLREQIRIEEEAKAKARVEAEALAKSQADAAAQKVIDDKARAEDEKAARLKCIQDDLDQANATNVANEAKRVAESGYQSITDEQVITSIVDEFDITFDESCNLIIRVAENMRVAA